MILSAALSAIRRESGRWHISSGPERMLTVAAGAHISSKRAEVGMDHVVGTAQRRLFTVMMARCWKLSISAKARRSLWRLPRADV